MIIIHSLIYSYVVLIMAIIKKKWQRLESKYNYNWTLITRCSNHENHVLVLCHVHFLHLSKFPHKIEKRLYGMVNTSTSGCRFCFCVLTKWCQLLISSHMCLVPHTYYKSLDFLFIYLVFLWLGRILPLLYFSFWIWWFVFLCFFLTIFLFFAFVCSKISFCHVIVFLHLCILLKYIHV